MTDMASVARHLVRTEVVRSEMLDAGEGEVAKWWSGLVIHILEEVPTEPGVAEAIAAYIVSGEDGA